MTPSKIGIGEDLAAALWARGMADPPPLAAAVRYTYLHRDSGDPPAPIRYRFAPGADVRSFDFREAEHPRGQPDNKGQFAPKGSGGGKPGGQPKPAGRDRTTRDGRPQPAAKRPAARQRPAQSRRVSPGDRHSVDPATAEPIRSKAAAMRRLLAVLREGPATPVQVDRRLAGVDERTRAEALDILAGLGAVERDREGGFRLVGHDRRPASRLPEPRRPEPPPREKAPRRQRQPKPEPPRFRESPIPGAPPIPVRRRGESSQAAAPVERKPALTPEQQAERTAAREKAEAEAAARKASSDREARRAQREERIQRLARVAEDHSVSPDDVLDVAKEITGERKRAMADREGAKQAARKLTGLTAGDLGRLENAGHDYTSGSRVGGRYGDVLAHWDEFAGELARDNPGVIGDPDDPSADLGAALWELIREGAQPDPSIYDPDVLYEAAAMIQAMGGGATGGDAFPWEDAGGWDDPEPAGAVPFARPGQPERYQRWCRRRLATVLAVALGVGRGV
jgi:hypothetical protein